MCLMQKELSGSEECGMYEYYNGLCAQIQYHEDIGLFTGFVVGPHAMCVSFSASSLDDALLAFREEADTYLKMDQSIIPGAPDVNVVPIGYAA